MSPAVRVLFFVAGCAAAFAAALGVGHLVGPSPRSRPRRPATAWAQRRGRWPACPTTRWAASRPPPAATRCGWPSDRLDAGPQRLAFTVTGPDGHPVTAYDEQHERDLHLIVVRRDLTGFQHVHPELDQSTGEWSTSVDLTPGAWRVLADFRPTGGEPLVLGTDLLVAGAVRAGAARRRIGSTRRSTTSTSPSTGEPHRRSGDAADRDPRPRRRARHRPAALPRRLRPPRLAARRRPGLPARPPRRGHRPGPGDLLPHRVPGAGSLPAVPRLPARRDGAHGGLHGHRGRRP